jgi:hypothetical protein
MKNFILSICYLIPFVTVAQSTWNNIPFSPYVYTEVTDAIIQNDTIILYGTVLNNAIDLQQGIHITKMDSSGNLIKSIFLISSPFLKILVRLSLPLMAVMRLPRPQFKEKVLF